MKNILLRAFITGLLAVIWLFGGFTLLSHIITNVPQATLRTLTGGLGLVVLFTGIYYAMRSERRQREAGGYTYLQALATGAFIAVVVAIMVAISSYIFVGLHPQFADDMAREAEACMRQQGAPQAAIAKKVAAVKNEFSLKQQVSAALIVQTAMGTMFSLVAAAFMKTKKQNPL